MPEEYRQTRQFRGATFSESDLNGATFRDCDLRNVRITSSWVDDLRVSGFDGKAGTVVVDDVVVTEFVAAELDRRHPERVQLRAVRTADDFRAAWATLEELWSGTVAHAGELPDGLVHERVDGEWSVTETLRHLVFAVDSWVGNLLLAGAAPYHRLGLPPTDMPDEAGALMGLDVHAEVEGLGVARLQGLLEPVDGVLRQGTDIQRGADDGEQDPQGDDHQAHPPVSP